MKKTFLFAAMALIGLVAYSQTTTKFVVFTSGCEDSGATVVRLDENDSDDEERLEELVPVDITQERQITINGLKIKEYYTREQLFEAVGQVADSCEYVEGEMLRLIFGTDFLCLGYGTSQSGYFDCFTLRGHLPLKVNGVVGVGDPVGKIDLLQPFRKKTDNTFPEFILIYAYMTDEIDDMNPMLFYVADGIIKRIGYVLADDIR